MEQSNLKAVLAEIYVKQGVPADQLPYSDDFESLYREVQQRTTTSMTRAEVWRHLANARKRGQLPRLKH